MDKLTLRECPFCGDSCVTWIANDEDSLEAMEAPQCSCGAQGPMYPTREQAIAAWNTRTDAELERLLAEVYKIGWREGCETLIEDYPDAEPPHKDAMNEGCGTFMADSRAALDTPGEGEG